jgi:hypothetical protein
LFLIVIYYYAKDVEFIKEYRNQRWIRSWYTL